jgi:hypothetical protein
MSTINAHGITLVGVSEIKNVNIERLATDPSVAEGGRIWYNTTEKNLKFSYRDGSNNLQVSTIGGSEVVSGLQAEVDQTQASLGTAFSATGSFVAAALVGSGVFSTPASLTDAVNQLAAYALAHDSLAELNDVQLSGVAQGDLLVQSSGSWANKAIGSQSGVQKHDATLDSLADLTTSGAVIRAADGSVHTATLVGPSSGVIVTNGDGVAGNPTIALANDLAAVEGLGSTGLAARTADGVWATRSITGTAGSINVLNGDGILGDPTLDLPDVGAPVESALARFTTDMKGRITDTSTVTAADITSLPGFDSQYVHTSGDSLSGNLAMNGNEVLGLPVVPSTGTAAVSKNYLDSRLDGLSWKTAVRAATTEDLAALSGLQTVDDVLLVAGDRILVKDQLVTSANGIYVVDAGAWTRAADLNAASEFGSAAVLVTQGTANQGSGWQQTNTLATVDTDPVQFVQFTSGAGIPQAGIGLSQVGNTLSVNLGAGIAQLPSDEVGVDLYSGTALFLTLNGSSASNDTDAKLSLRVGNSLTQTNEANALEIANGGVKGVHLETITSTVNDQLVKVSSDVYGRVTGTSAVTTADLTPLLDATYVNASGDTLTGPLVLAGFPTQALEAANKQYVDDESDRAVEVEGALANLYTDIQSYNLAEPPTVATLNLVRAINFVYYDLVRRATNLSNQDTLLELLAERTQFRTKLGETTPLASYTINHNLNSEFVDVQVWVKDTVSGTWMNDLVSVQQTNANTLQVDLTEARAVVVTVRRSSSLAEAITDGLIDPGTDLPADPSILVDPLQ